MEAAEVAKASLACLDLTLLDADESDDEVLALVEAANQHHPAAICLLPVHIELAKNHLQRGIGIACVAGCFPDGDGEIEQCIAEIEAAIAAGADEIDVVIDFEAIKRGDGGSAARRIAAYRAAAANVTLKVILETPELDSEQLDIAAMLALEFGADFLKTCTGKRGSCTPNATQQLAEIIARWNHEHPGNMRGLKVAGGVSSLFDAEMHIGIVRHALGDGFVHPATFRIGASSLLDDILSYLE